MKLEKILNYIENNPKKSVIIGGIALYTAFKLINGYDVTNVNYDNFKQIPNIKEYHLEKYNIPTSGAVTTISLKDSHIEKITYKNDKLILNGDIAYCIDNGEDDLFIDTDFNQSKYNCDTRYGKLIFEKNRLF
jgi:hypothetical protein